MRFTMQVKLGRQTVKEVRGQDVALDLSTLTAKHETVKLILDLERSLEKLFGYRFHINQEK